VPLSKQRCKAPPAQISNNKLKPAHASFPFIFARKPATQACTQPLFLLASLAPTKLLFETSLKPAPTCNTLLPVPFALCQSKWLLAYCLLCQACHASLHPTTSLLASLAPTKLVFETSLKPAPTCNTLLPVPFALCQSRLLANLPPLPVLFISYPGRVPKPSQHTVTRSHQGFTSLCSRETFPGFLFRCPSPSPSKAKSSSHP